MSELEHGGAALGRIHAASNDRKYFCHFTGFLEGIVASGAIEVGEVEPLIVECVEFVKAVADGDATDIIEDFKADLLEQETLVDAVSFRSLEIDESCKKSSLNRFLGFCRGVVADGHITRSEAKKLVSIVLENPELLEAIGVQQVLVTCVDAVEDNIVDQDESNEICKAIGEIVGDSYGDTGISQTSGTANFAEYRLENPEVELDGAVVVLTGTFQMKPRSKIEKRLVELGASISKSVSKKVDFVLVGGEASRDWIELNRGTKIRAAQKLRIDFERPEFLSEAQLLRRLK